ncbi:MAG: ABC transporter ATP-binding protein [Clostridia bacterium]|nr:ABC transporter ATP-binding protein [Clostridia bacterium]
MHELIKCENLSMSYGGTMALRDINLSIPNGRIIGLLGPNGSGKTTFMKLAAGLLVPTQGSIRIGGHPIGPESKSMVSFLPEKTYLNSALSVSDALELFNDFYADFDDNAAASMLAKLDIPLNARMKTLSKGTKEKVQLILVMARKAQLYLLDEPIAGVDPAARDYILDTMLSNFHADATLIISTHLIYDIERILDEFIFLQNGSIVAYDTVDNARQTNSKSIDELFREVFRC